LACEEALVKELQKLYFIWNYIFKIGISKKRSRNDPNHISIWENDCQPFDLTQMRSDPLLCKRKKKKKKKKKQEKQESELASPGPIQIWPGPRFRIWI
jgi:hypothetical protein